MLLFYLLRRLANIIKYWQILAHTREYFNKITLTLQNRSCLAIFHFKNYPSRGIINVHYTDTNNIFDGRIPLQPELGNICEVPIILSFWCKDDSVCQNHSKCTKLIMCCNFPFCIFHITDTNNVFDGRVLTSYHRSICEDPIILSFCVQR